jgi:hypothetical protein
MVRRRGDRSRSMLKLLFWSIGLVSAGGVWFRLNAPGSRLVLVVGSGFLGTAILLWFHVPEFYEAKWLRRRVAEYLAAGLVAACVLEAALPLIPFSAESYAGYRLPLWLAAAAVIEAVKGGAALAVFSRTGLTSSRRVMTAFAATGLAFAITQPVLRALGLGVQPGHWGLEPVWAAYASYPMVSAPANALLSGLVGSAWARWRHGEHTAAAIAVSAAVFGQAWLNATASRSVFNAIPVLCVVIAVWWLAFAQSSEPAATTLLAVLPDT